MAYQNGPYVKKQSPGKVAWCSCGESEKAPYCDGSHARKNTGKSPVVVEVTEERTLSFCGCGKTGKAPYCDGSHKKA